MRNFIIDKLIYDYYFNKTGGFYPFFKYCPDYLKEYYLKKRAYNVLGYEYNFKEPKTLNEKIRWLVYNEKLDLKTKLTDKILCKSYVALRLGQNHSADLYGIYDNFKEIDFSVMPRQFALKANHGWRMNILVKNKSKLLTNYTSIEKLTKRWLRTNLYDFSLEPQYKGIKRKLFAEYLRPWKNDSFRREIQVYCFNGNPVLIELPLGIYNRIYYSQFYDTNWKLQKYYTKPYYVNQENPAPQELETLLEYSKILSADFNFVRIDFAIFDNNIHVVEMTFTPCSAIIPFAEQSFDIELGEMLNIK